MSRREEQERAQARQARQAAVVMVVATLVWILGHEIGRQYEWEPRYAFLLDFAALGAFVWALVMVWRIWRARRDTKR